MDNQLYLPESAGVATGRPSRSRVVKREKAAQTTDARRGFGANDVPRTVEGRLGRSDKLSR